MNRQLLPKTPHNFPSQNLFPNDETKSKHIIANALSKSCLLIMTTFFFPCSSYSSTNPSRCLDWISLILFLPSYPLIPCSPSFPFFL